MPLGNAVPFGLRDVKLTPFTTPAATALAASSIDLPLARTLSFTDSESFTELRGDDQLAASRGSGGVVNWDLEGGGISLAAYAAMAGGVVTESGVTPNQIKTYSKSQDSSRPYFQVEGQALNDNGGDLHGLIYRAKATGDITGSMGDGEFLLTGASGTSFPSLVTATLGKVYDWVQNETAEDLS